jgi:hypothetical protein
LRGDTVRIENTQNVKDLMLRAVAAELENLPEVGETLDARVLAAEGAAARIKTAGGLVLAARLEGSAMLTAGETVTLTVDEVRDGFIAFRLKNDSDGTAPDDRLQLTAAPEDADVKALIRAYSDKPQRAAAQPPEQTPESAQTVAEAPADAARAANAPADAPETAAELPAEPREPVPTQSTPQATQNEQFNPPVAARPAVTENPRAAAAENIPQAENAPPPTESEIRATVSVPEIAVRGENSDTNNLLRSVITDNTVNISEPQTVTVRDDTQPEIAAILTDGDADDVPTPRERPVSAENPELPDEQKAAVTHTRERVRNGVERPAEDAVRVLPRAANEETDAARSVLSREGRPAPAQAQIVNEIRPQSAQETQPPQTAFAQLRLPVELRGEKREAEIFVRRGRANRDGGTDSTDMLLSLDLPAMGKWDAAVTVTGRELTIRMKTESEPARELLINSAEQLSALVELAGFHLTSSRVSVRGEGSPLPEAAKPIRRGRAVDLSI